jgi:conjugative transfer region protein TrbK
MTLMRSRVVALIVFIATSLAGCTVPLRCEPDAVLGHAEGPSALDGRLMRCGALGAKAAAEDPDCQSAWAEARQRILPPPTGK